MASSKPACAAARRLPEPAKAWLRYLRSRSFAWDLLSLLPIDIVLLAVGNPWWAAGRLPRVLRCVDLFSAFRGDTFLRNQNVPSSTMHIVKQLSVAFILAHWFGCLYFFLGDTLEHGFEHGATSWISEDEHLMEGHGVVDQYIQSVYWGVCLSMMYIHLGGHHPTRMEEVYYVSIGLVTSLLSYVTMYGNMEHLMVERMQHNVQVRKTMRWLSKYSRTCEMDELLSTRLARYLKSSHDSLSQGGLASAKSVIAMLPASCRSELMSHIHAHIVRTNPLFRLCDDPAFISEIVMSLTSSKFAPGDVIIRIGDIGHEMYFLLEGSVNVYAADGRFVKNFDPGRHPRARPLGHPRALPSARPRPDRP